MNILRIANQSTPTVFRKLVNGTAMIKEIVSAAVMLQIIQSSKYKVCGSKEPIGVFDPTKRLLQPTSQAAVHRAEKVLIYTATNGRFRKVFELVPFIPFQHELPKINFEPDFQFVFCERELPVLTEENQYEFQTGISNIRFDGQTFAANCRHPTSHWDEHPWCVACLLQKGIDSCPDYWNDEEEVNCPYCLVMGPIAVARRRKMILDWKARLKKDPTRVVTQHPLKVGIRTQFDADYYSKIHDFNPNWLKGYYGFCRPSWAVPVFMSWQEFWVALHNEVQLLSDINAHREIFNAWACGRLAQYEERCGGNPCGWELHELPQLTVTPLPEEVIHVQAPVLPTSRKAYPLYEFKRKQGASKTKRTPVRRLSRKQSDASVMSVASFDYSASSAQVTPSETPQGSPLRPQRTPKRTRERSSEPSEVRGPNLRPRMEKPDYCKEEALTESEPASDREMQSESEPEDDGTGEPNLKQKAAPIPVSTAASTSVRLYLTTSGGLPASPQAMITSNIRNPEPRVDITRCSVTTSPGAEGEVSATVSLSAASLDSSEVRPQTPFTSVEVTLPQSLTSTPVPTTQSRLADWRGGAREKCPVSGLVMSPKLGGSFAPRGDASTAFPASGIWTSLHSMRGLTRPSQNTREECAPIRYQSISSAAHLRREFVQFVEPVGPPVRGYDSVKRPLRPSPTYNPGDRVISAVNRTLDLYCADAYSPEFPRVVMANCAGCAKSPIGVTPLSPIPNEKGAYPQNSTSMHLIQKEAIRMEANCRSMSKILEHESYLIPALIDYVNLRLHRQSVQADDEALRDVVDALRMNLMQRENLTGENLGILTAVRRRDNIERLTNRASLIDQAVSAPFDDQSGELISAPDVTGQQDESEDTLN
jgi:hypothetical protein